MDISSLSGAGTAAAILGSKQAVALQEVQIAVMKQSAETLQQLTQIIQATDAGRGIDVYA
jgi:hypothetical protein